MFCGISIDWGNQKSYLVADDEVISREKRPNGTAFAVGGRHCHWIFITVQPSHLLVIISSFFLQKMIIWKEKIWRFWLKHEKSLESHIFLMCSKQPITKGRGRMTTTSLLTDAVFWMVNMRISIKTLVLLLSKDKLMCLHMKPFYLQKRHANTYALKTNLIWILSL